MQFVDKKKRLLLSQSAGGGKLLLFCAAVFIPILCWYLAESGEYNRVQDRLSRAGKMRQTMLASELAVDIDRLLSVERFFASSESVLPDEFRTFTYNLIGPSSSISSIAWIAKEGAAYRTVYSEPPRDSEIRSALEVPELRAALDRAEMSGAARAAIAPSFRLAGGQPDASIYLIVPELKTANEAGASAESDSRGFAVGKIKLSRLTTSALRSLLPDGPEIRSPDRYSD